MTGYFQKKIKLMLVNQLCEQSFLRSFVNACKDDNTKAQKAIHDKIISSLRHHLLITKGQPAHIDYLQNGHQRIITRNPVTSIYEGMPQNALISEVLPRAHVGKYCRSLIIKEIESLVASEDIIPLKTTNGTYYLLSRQQIVSQFKIHSDKTMVNGRHASEPI